VRRNGTEILFAESRREYEVISFRFTNLELELRGKTIQGFIDHQGFMNFALSISCKIVPSKRVQFEE